jgi:hypothetical protein
MYSETFVDLITEITVHIAYRLKIIAGNKFLE